MAHRKGTTLAGAVASLIDEEKLLRDAKRVGYVQRERKQNVLAFVWTLILGFEGRQDRTMAGLHASYNLASANPVAWSTFSAWFRPTLAPLLKALVDHLLAVVSHGVHGGQELLAKFQDVLAIDTVVIRLHEALERPYPACRTNHTKAAAKVHAVVSVTGHSASKITLTSERVNDRAPFRKIGDWVRNRLLLFDLGYYSHSLFDRIDRRKGWFISRLKTTANPKIVGLNRLWRGRSVPVIGQHLQDFVGRLKREVLDVMVEVSVPRRTYNGTSRSVRRKFRVVGVRDEVDGCYHLYITNIPSTFLSPQEVASLYAARWVVELTFRELGQNHRLKDMPSADRAVVESLIYASFLSLIASRRIVSYLRAKVSADRAHRITEERTAAIFAQSAILILPLVIRKGRVVLTTSWLETVVAAGALDPHLDRPRLAMRVDQGHQLSYMEATREAALQA